MAPSGTPSDSLYCTVQIMARTPRSPEQRAADAAQHRKRILGGLAASIAVKGYAGTTIADIAAAAGVSKATVYEHFQDKHDAFLALYSEASDNVVAVISRHIADPAFGTGDWQAELRRIASGYLTVMAAGGPLTRCLLTEVASISDATRELYREVVGRYVAVLRTGAERIAEHDAAVAVPSDRVLLGLSGGVAQLMLAALDGDGPTALPAVGDAMSDLLTVGLLGAGALQARGERDGPPVVAHEPSTSSPPSDPIES